MPDRRGATVLDDLPAEITVDKILARLPPKDVGRCRAVRRSWRSATSTPEFTLEHHRRQPSLPIVDGRPSRFVVLRDSDDGSSSDQQLWPFLPHATDNDRICLHAASGGLLVFSQGCRFHICNPATRRRAALPQPPNSLPRYGILGLYRHDSTGEHRVLWSSCMKLQDRNAITLHVLTVGDNESRAIRVTLPTPRLEQALLEGLPRNNHYSEIHPPVRHRDNLHWLRRCCATGMGEIIVFDTEAESFRWMHLPIQPGHFDKLFDMKGNLALCSVDRRGTAMGVWVMQDYEAENWAFKFRIDVLMIEASRPLDLTSGLKKEKGKTKKHPLDSMTVEYISAMTMLDDHELLIQFNAKHALHWDIDGKFLRMAKIGKRQCRMELTPHRLQESIIPIPGGEMEKEDEPAPWEYAWMFSS
ncbi:hypothetical protein ACQJBY_039561 [Aegilops geniculata]